MKSGGFVFEENSFVNSCLLLGTEGSGIVQIH